MTAGGVHDLLRDASELVPGVLELEVEELIAGLRPGTPDNAPIVGASPAAPELVWATGHYRNGALLTPVTADLVVAALCGEETDAAFSPRRFAGVRGVIYVNGEPHERDGATIAELLADLGVEARARGVAVAVDGEVVPRGRVGRPPHQRGRARRGAVRHAGRLSRHGHRDRPDGASRSPSPTRRSSSAGARCARA